MKASKRPTSKDVAELAGVSRATVSYVINNKSDGNIRISEETFKRVWDAVKELGYHPSLTARALRTNRSNLLALMIPHIRTSFHPLLASSVQNALDGHGMDLIVHSSKDDEQRENAFINSLLGRGVDGVIIQSNHIDKDHLDPLVNSGVAVVVLGNGPRHPYIDNIICNEAQAVEEVVNHLAANGHRRIAIISGPENTWSSRLRVEGYLQGLQYNGIEKRDEYICEAEFFVGSTAIDAMRRLLALPEPPTAVFASNDLLAANALLFAQDNGISVPEQLAIVGFNDTPEACMTRPRLTTIKKDIDPAGTTSR